MFATQQFLKRPDYLLNDTFDLYWVSETIDICQIERLVLSLVL